MRLNLGLLEELDKVLVEYGLVEQLGDVKL